MQLDPYLFFNGNCEEALNFYKDCLGGEFEGINRFKDGPEEMAGCKVPEDYLDKVMHMTWRFGDNVIMASDGLQEVPAGGNITLSISMDDVDEMSAVFDKISGGGQVTMPLQDTFWGSRFGMITDKFGMKWMFSCSCSK